MTAAAQLFHNDLYVDRTVAAGTDAQRTVNIFHDNDTDINTADGNHRVGSLSRYD